MTIIEVAQDRFEKWVIDNSIWINGSVDESAMMLQCYEQGLKRAIEIIESVPTTVSVYASSAEAKAASYLKDVLIAKIQAEI